MGSRQLCLPFVFLEHTKQLPRGHCYWVTLKFQAVDKSVFPTPLESLASAPVVKGNALQCFFELPAAHPGEKGEQPLPRVPAENSPALGLPARPAGQGHDLRHRDALLTGGGTYSEFCCTYEYVSYWRNSHP